MCLRLPESPQAPAIEHSLNAGCRPPGSPYLPGPVCSDSLRVHAPPGREAGDQGHLPPEALWGAHQADTGKQGALPDGVWPAWTSRKQLSSFL